MAIRHYQLTLAATRQRLSAALANTEVGGADDVAYRQLILSTSGADAFIGGPTVSTTDYGRALDSADAENQVSIGPFESGAVKLSDLYAVGAGATLHIFGIPF